MEAFTFEVSTDRLGGGEPLVTLYHVSAMDVSAARILLRAQLDLLEGDHIRLLRALNASEIEDLGLREIEVRLAHD